MKTLSTIGACLSLLNGVILLFLLLCGANALPSFWQELLYALSILIIVTSLLMLYYSLKEEKLKILLTAIIVGILGYFFSLLFYEVHLPPTFEGTHQVPLVAFLFGIGTYIALIAGIIDSR